MNLLEQMQESNDPMIIAIKDHLLSRNDTKELLEKDNKNVSDMKAFITYSVFENYVKNDNSSQRAGCAVLKDEDVFSFAMHYLDEDDIDMKEIEKKMSRTLRRPPVVQNTQQKAKKVEKKEENIPKDTQIDVSTKKKPKKKAKKSNVAEGQLSIFDL